MSKQQSGFTLVELVVVIVILGILAATANPKYASYTTESRIAALNGLAGAVRSSVAIVQGRYVATGAVASPVTMLDGTTVSVAIASPSQGIPTAAAGGIGAAVNTGGTFVLNGAGTQYDFPTVIANCFVTYAPVTGAATVTSAGC